jgi:DNA-binding PadR family transcriptional regulator
MNKDLSKIIEQFVDLLMPELTPYEVALYLFLFRHSLPKNNSLTVRIGKKTIIEKFVKNPRGGGRPSFANITVVLKELERKGCIKVGDVDREGTFYEIILPEKIRSVAEKLAVKSLEAKDDDYFTDTNKRKELFERDKWICHYCGELVTEKNATLDHFIPQSKGGKNTKDNLKTCCLVCNSIKSGKTYEEAAPFLLKSIREKKAKMHN